MLCFAIVFWFFVRDRFLIGLDEQEMVSVNLLCVRSALNFNSPSVSPSLSLSVGVWRTSTN